MKLQQLSPILWTKNLEETTLFYVNVLGFTSHSNFPDFVSLFNGEVQIMFVARVEEPYDCKITGDLYIFTEKVDELWEALQGKAKIKTAIADREYLMRDFSILDNNGYELCFGEDISNKK